MLSQSVTFPPLRPEPLAEIECFMKEKRRLGYTTREEFVRDSVRWRLNFLKEDFEYVEIPRKKYGRLEEAIKEMNASYYNVSDFIHGQIEEVLDQYEKWQEEKRLGGKSRKKNRI